MKKKFTAIFTIVLVLAVSAFSFSGCNVDSTDTGGSLTTEITDVSFDSDDTDETFDEDGDATYTVVFSTSGISAEKGTVSSNVLTITNAGTYVLSGTSSNARIVVNADKCLVQLVLNGLDLTSASCSPIIVESAEKVVITVAEGTVNTLSDASSYSVTTDSTAAIYSADDLTINGTGSLTVNGNYNNAIQCKDTLKIMSVTLIVNSVDDGIIGKDYLAIDSGTITVTADGDGIKATNDTDTDCGNVLISGSTLTITSGADAIQAATGVLISGGTIKITSGGGSGNSLSSSDTGSYKGIKATGDVRITGGTIDINSKDDAIHSNDSLRIDSCVLTIKSGDDGIHSDTALEINGGTITISKSYEGIESNEVTINGGTISVVASDDGINTAGGTDTASTERPGMNTFSTSSSDYNLIINGGVIYVNAAGDGLDANGSITLNGGTVMVDGPTDNGNGYLDYDKSFTANGGLLIATGSKGMAQAASAGTTNYSKVISFNYTKSANTVLHIEDSSGNTILNYIPSKAYVSFVLVCGDMSASGNKVYTGGTLAGDTIAFNLYSKTQPIRRAIM